MDCWKSWQISLYRRSKFALCLMRRSFNKIWNFVTAIDLIWHCQNEELSSKSFFISSSLFSHLSESKLEAKNHLFALFLHLNPHLIGSSLIVATQLFQLQDWNLQKRISSNTAYVITHFYTIGSPTMPNVMFKWLLSSKPAFKS